MKSTTLPTVKSSVFRSFEQPIRSEIFSVARLEMHGESLARAQTVTTNSRRGKKIGPRIEENREVLEASFNSLLVAVAKKHAITPAAEWLLDNFHIVRAQLKDIHDHLPSGFYRELPKLADGHLAGYPRVYGIAWAFVAHTDSLFDPEPLKQFLRSYQNYQPLSIGELWAVPITLRLVLIENLRRLSARIVGSQTARYDADRIANELLGLNDGPTRPVVEIIKELRAQAFVPAFAVQLLQRLRFQDSKINPVLDWLDEQLIGERTTAEEVVSNEHASQTGADASVRNIINSFRLMSAFNWQEFFEAVSLVDERLNRHSLFSQMDFATRDRYRHGLEELARYSPLTELEVADTVLARLEVNNSPHRRHLDDPGYYLIASGRHLLEKQIGFRAPLRMRLIRAYSTHATPIYLGAIALTAILMVIFPLYFAFLNHSNALELLLLGILALFPASEIGVALINRWTTDLLGPRHLARLSLEQGVPAILKTCIVVPTMINDLDRIEAQVEQLEIHYLSNPSGELYFALLTDWHDSSEESKASDEPLLELLVTSIELLNRKYGPMPDGANRFYALHRRRRYNAGEGKWIGWERKRGKLQEFNQLLHGSQSTSFMPRNGVLSYPKGIRYVITLDADTRLPNGSAVQLIGSMAHPLNQARLNDAGNRVVGGYGILQPRITPTLPSTHESTIFQRLSTGPCGIDPYASAVSDVYQDLFGEGSYTGKGIYDVAAFEAALANRIPENTLLSHDLFEGNYARCGFLSDVELFEDFPSHSGVAAARSHRWTRGDWQLLPWALGTRSGEIRFIGRWKMIDNLRRSLVAPAMFLLLIAAAAIPNAQPTGWLLLFFGALTVSAIVQLLVELRPSRQNISLRQHFSSLLQDLGTGMGRLFLSLSLLANNAWNSFDAIARALYRLVFSHRLLLEWTTGEQAKAAASFTLNSFIVSMKGGVALALAGLIPIIIFNPHHLPFYLPFFALWVLAPGVARHLSLPPKEKQIVPLKPEDIQLLHLSARKIWRFFATFVNEGENFLPPDNFQEDPAPVVAHRSSPTNFGLYLLSVMAARDFGWIGVVEMANRLEETLKAMDHLPRFQGHFFNWYETSEARALEPKYISSVDNGNLAGHLLAVAEGCLENLRLRITPTGFNRGILHTLLLLENAISSSALKNGTRAVEFQVTEDALGKLALLLLTPDHLIPNRLKHWESLLAHADLLVRAANDISLPAQVSESREIIAWSRALLNDIKSSAADFNSLAPWTEFSRVEVDLQDPVQQHFWQNVRERLTLEPSVKEIPAYCDGLVQDILQFKKLTSIEPEFARILEQLLESLESATSDSKLLIAKLSRLYALCHKLYDEMDFGLLYDPFRKLFSIGYRVAENQLDASYYDLLASEARLTSFVAIAKGDVPAAHWFQLGRPLTAIDKDVALVSWSGSMFEYLMPSLVMFTPPGSLIDKTCQLIVKRQIEYGIERGIPWGISESAYNRRDLQLTYQYSNFGVPDLGLKRGLETNLVVAPYATLLAAMYEPALAVENLRRLQKLGAEGVYGFYDAVDFTPTRLPDGKTEVVVKNYMAHHQGMAFISIANVFKHGVMRRRFHSEPAVQAAELLLQERTPRNVAVTKPSEESFQVGLVKEHVEHVSRRYHTVNRAVPVTQLLANDHYSVMLTSSGSGYSRCGSLGINRWREDVTKDNWGNYFYLRDCSADSATDQAKIWSATYQPTCVESEDYQVTFTDDRAKFSRVDHGILSRLEIFISPEDNGEVRRLSLTNESESARQIEVTSYFEVTLATQAADLAHPAFSNLFVQTEYLPELKALIATRRPRSAKDKQLWMAQVLLTDRFSYDAVEYETDRAQFLGRGRSNRSPLSICNGKALSNTVGSVLDPIMSLRTKLSLEPGITSHLVFSTVIADSREEVIRLADKFRDESTIERATDLAWTQAQVKLHHLNIEPDESHLFQRLATRLIFSESSLRPSSDFIRENKKDVTGLWAQSISGDVPIMVIRIDDIEDRGIVRQLLKAHEYLSEKHLKIDLVILNDKVNSYAQELQDALLAMVRAASTQSNSDPGNLRGKIFVLRTEQLSPEERVLIYSTARVVLSSRQGTLADQVRRMRAVTTSTKLFEPVRVMQNRQILLPAPDLDFYNGTGGFDPITAEYVIVLHEGMNTPSPWINVIANSQFGFQVSESGSGFTWSLNSRENQMTPWSNDPISDPTGEAFYIRDLESGCVWSPTALPIRIADASYIARHGQGFSKFETLIDGIKSELTQFVPGNDSLKISRLKLKNLSKEPRQLSISNYVEWVLGFSRETMAPTTVTEFDSTTEALFAFNSRSNEYGHRISFLAAHSTNGAKLDSWTCDRTEFIGRNGHLGRPAAVQQEVKLTGRAGGGLDSCASLQMLVSIEASSEVEVVFVLGQADSRPLARELILKYRQRSATAELDAVVENWEETLGKIQVETPDASMNLMLNRWLLYQTMVCRFWARSAFYQAGGAFGFRDQLQDVLALATSQPELSRAHILRAASRQFVEGDVQHWWHPPFGRGVRTRISDDLLWLPYVVCHYLSVTGDVSILEAEASFLEGPLLNHDQEDSYYTPTVTHNTASIFEHCARALDHSLKVGSHGLPLMGSGDWNDGMNRVGAEGKGESVWLAWFLHTNLVELSKIAERRGEVERVSVWRKHATEIAQAAEDNAWDGDWYRRAYFDDGTPLGSSLGKECRIDSLSQTWAVISKAANVGRAAQAMQAVHRELVKPEDKMILLFTPPFDHGSLDPGYIQGYLPGVRENGGQYTHAAVWCVVAEAMLGHGEKAHDLFKALNPVNHALTPSEVQRYKVEPYVLAADVYSVAPYNGRGGWTWYTGAAGWMYRAGLEYILGLRLEGNHLVIDPCIPPSWKEFKIRYRHGKSNYLIQVLNPEGRSKGVSKIVVNRVPVEAQGKIRLVDDGKEHDVLIILGER